MEITKKECEHILALRHFQNRWKLRDDILRIIFRSYFWGWHWRWHRPETEVFERILQRMPEGHRTHVHNDDLSEGYIAHRTNLNCWNGWHASPQRMSLIEGERADSLAFAREAMASGHVKEAWVRWMFGPDASLEGGQSCRFINALKDGISRGAANQAARHFKDLIRS